ncbi:MAG: site-specific integrase [Planctomycetes bacterium]|nr:site-specific integrase [Planctomycetota bacterium]
MARVKISVSQFQRKPSSHGIQEVTAKYLAYLETAGRRPSTLKRYRPELDRFERFFAERGVRVLEDATLDMVDSYATERRSKSVAAATLYHEITLLRQLANFSASRALISQNPLRGYKMKKPKPQTQPCFSEQQLERIIDTAAEPFNVIYLVLAYSGLRIGELKWLRWKDVDFDRNVIIVREKEGWQPKTGEGREVPMLPRVREALSSLPRKSKWVFTAPASRQYPRGDHQISERRALSRLKTILKRLDIPEGHLHTFRHYFISMCATGGTSPTTIMEWVGHGSLDMVLRYFHLSHDESQEAMSRLTQAIENKQENRRQGQNEDNSVL